MTSGPIVENTMKVMVQKSYEKNKTTLFILPLLFTRYESMNRDFLNAYLHEDGKILAVVYKRQNPKLQKYSPCAVKMHGSTVIYFFNIKYLEPLVKDFINGNYSQLTATSKSRILKFWGASIDGHLYNILYPTSVIGILPKEGMEKPNMNHETLNLRNT